MKKSIYLLVWAALLLSACQSSVGTDTPLSGETDFTLQSDFTPPTEPQRGMGTAGPFEHRLLTAWSDDGIDWERTNELVTEQANTPDMVVSEDGSIYLYYTAGNIDGEDHLMAVAISEDGSNWVYKKVVIDEQPEGTSPAGDPDIVRLEDGRYRLFFTAQLQGQEKPGILYAEGEDGIHFTYQGQAAYSADAYQLMDSITYPLDNNWGMVSLNSHETEQVQMLSEDGVHFAVQKVEDVLVNDRPAFFSNHLQLADGTLWMYAWQMGGGFSIFETSDGLNWEQIATNIFKMDETTGMETLYLKDPAVVQVPDGRYFMVYVTRAPE